MPAPHPLCSVITRTKDRPSFLRRALQSVASQAFKDWELVIVNDGGDASGVELALAESSLRMDPRVKVLHLATNVGMEAASNYGIQNSRGKYIVIHDDDDSWDSTFLLLTLAQLETARASAATEGICVHTVNIFEELDSQGKIQEIGRRPYNVYQKSISLSRILGQTSIPPISFVFSRAAYLKVGPFREDLPVLGDWDFLIRFLTAYDIDLIPQVLAFYHIRDGLTAGVNANTVRAQRDVHVMVDQRLRNEYLRQSLQQSPGEAGTLMTLIGAYNHLFNGMDEIARRLERIEKLLREKAEPQPDKKPDSKIGEAGKFPIP